MLTKLPLIFECSRIFSLPMTIMSWLVIFTYSATVAGNKLYGFIALIGVCLVHLATNTLDDYFDYKSLIKQVNFDKKEYLKNSQKTKCRYLISGMIKEKDVLYLAMSYLFIAGLIGLFFFLKCGVGVLYFVLVGGFIAVLYSFFSKIRLSELVIAIAYGPALFGGIYYVMTKTYSWEVFVLSIPTMLITVILLYIHTVMDFEFDINEGHNTIANAFDSPLAALVVLKWLIILAYLSPIILCILDIADWQVLLCWLTIPLAVDLYKSMVDYTVNSDSIPEHKWFHFPMEDMHGAPSFMIRMYQSRNLTIYYTVLFVIGLVLSYN